MAGTYTHATLHHRASQRGVAMALAFVAVVLLSPLYVRRKHEMKLSSGFVLLMVLTGLIISIRITSSPSSCSRPNGGRAWLSPSPDPTCVIPSNGPSSI
ncbi:hypothetical protein V6N11_065083 [Hibiscus sabdariffa]|uniref:Uncharacterized protein n=1 Tax=Hibiscus sabdariffa TaxID=183260 RepID=A0ABR2SJ66_9ROSI